MALSNRQLELYNNLLSLRDKSESFYYVDQEKNGNKLRIYLYRIASYSDWLHPDALESRGITFLLDKNDNPVELVCRPMKKFFSYLENPLTMNLDLNTITQITEKLDGSLISTYWIDGEMHLKTKGSLHSEQAIAATKLLKSKEYRKLWYYSNLITAGLNATINFEYTHISNRIIIAYEKASLTILSIRDNETGKEITLDDIKKMLPNCTIEDYWVTDYTEITREIGFERFINSVVDIQDNIEGYVVKLNDGTTFKTKTQKYCILHRNKDSISSQRNLFECSVMETTDDLKSLFHNDPITLKSIEDMDKLVKFIFSNSHVIVDNFYDENKHLSRKDYAILGKEQLAPCYFPLAMLLYIGKEINWKEFLIKNWDIWKVKYNLHAPEVNMDQ